MNARIAFRPTDTGLVTADLGGAIKFTYFKLVSDASDVAQTGITLTELGLGVYRLHRADGAAIDFRCYLDAAPTIYYDGVLSIAQSGDTYALAAGATGFAAIDTVVDAIKAKTDNLPASPAAVGSNMGTVSSVTGAVGSVTGAVGSVTGAVGSVTAGVTVTTNNDKTGYALTTAPPTAVENADALLARNVSGGSSAGRTVKQALHFLRNKWSISGTTLTVTDTDDSTPSWTATVGTDAAAVPIVSNDPG